MNLIISSAIIGVILMLCGLYMHNKRLVTYLALGAMAIAIVLNTMELATGNAIISLSVPHMLQPTRFGLLMNEIMLLAALFLFILNGRDIEKMGNHAAEYYAIIFFIFAGIGVVTSYTNLLMLFLGIEIISIPLYVLTTADKENLKSNEAALKYFLMGAFSTGTMLLGIALVYGATGSFLVENLGKELFGKPVIYGGPIIGILMLFFSMAFKVSAAPFHFWAPDVYDGAPTPVASFMTTIIKIAAFVAFILLFKNNYDKLHNKWFLIMAITISLTLIIGNVTALFQQSVKRMLAYSSISHAGFMLFALFAFNQRAMEGIVIYAAAYSMATIGIFAILMKMSDYTYEGFNGLGRSHPLIGFSITIFVLSLAGIPLTIGFMGKFYMLSSGILAAGKYLWLFVLAVICAAISIGYYFRILQSMYFKENMNQPIVVTKQFKVALFCLCLLVILLGIMPQFLIQFLYF